MGKKATNKQEIESMVNDANETVKRFQQQLRPLKQVYVPHRDAKRIVAALDRLMLYGNISAGRASPARCLLITGESGSGKTTTVERWCRQFSVEETPEGDKRPVLYIEVPPKCTTKSLAENMLRAMGLADALASRGSEAALTERVKHHLREQEVQVVVLDEVQHLVDTKSRRVISSAADFVKTLLNSNSCPIVLAGMPEARVIFEVNEQLARRALGRFVLGRFDWSNEEHQTYFAAILAACEKHLPFSNPSNLSMDVDAAYGIWQFSEGVVGRAVDFLYAACVRGLVDGAECLTKEILWETAEDFRESTEWANPFEVLPRAA